MLLGSRQITSGDVRRYVIDYSEFLQKGTTLTTPSASISAGATSTVESVSLDDTNTKMILYVTGGSVLNETFTVNVVVHDTNNQVVNDTIDFTVVSP